MCSLDYVLTLQEPSETPFDIDSVPKEVRAVPASKERAGGKRAGKDAAAAGGPTKAAGNPGEVYEKLLGSVPEFSSFGKLFKVRALVLASQFVFWTLEADSHWSTECACPRPGGVGGGS